MDLVTPRNVHFTAFYKRSFAYYTIKDRVPVILTQVIDSLVRYKDKIGKEHDEQAKEELKMVIGEVSKLKYEIQTNKPLTDLETNSPDATFYNDFIAKHATEEGPPTYFGTVFLFAECYMYRRIYEIFEKLNILKDFDPFRSQKEEAFYQASEPMIVMSNAHKNLLIKENTLASIKEGFIDMLKFNLWGNKCDLSISNGLIATEIGDSFAALKSLEPYILSDQSEEIWAAISDGRTTSQIVDIVLDNSGYELFTDFCTADYIITNNLAKKVRFYVKAIPWFISDVTEPDFYWVLKHIVEHQNVSLAALGRKWDEYVKNGTWTVEVHSFWTLPVDFSYMERVDRELYKKLSEAKLIIFKGDLNYRKLFGEKNWDPTTSLEIALQGFNPAKLCTLRTVKCDVVCGLRPGVIEEVEAKNKKWMYKGDYGLIQFSGLVKKLPN